MSISRSHCYESCESSPTVLTVMNRSGRNANHADMESFRQIWIWSDQVFFWNLRGAETFHTTYRIDNEAWRADRRKVHQDKLWQRLVCESRTKPWSLKVIWVSCTVVWAQVWRSWLD